MTQSQEPAATSQAIHAQPSAGGVTPKVVIGLLGAPGSGKSVVARCFQELGCQVIDADQLAKAALNEQVVIDELVQWWGPGVLDEAGRVNRKAVANIVFADEKQRRRLEGLIHPRVHAARHKIRKRAADDAAIKAIVEDCPLILERGLDAGCDVLVFVETSRTVRLARLAQTRGWDAAEMDRREASQVPLDTKRQRADYVINNDATKSQTHLQVRRVLSHVLQQTSQAGP